MPVYTPETAPRCPRCRYSLFGLGEMLRCPECGLELDDDNLVAARWLADDNAPNRRAVALDRTKYYAGLALAATGFALLLWRHRFDTTVVVVIALPFWFFACFYMLAVHLRGHLIFNTLVIFSSLWTLLALLSWLI